MQRWHSSNGQHLPIPHDSIEWGLSGEFGLPDFNELPYFWEDIELYSHDMASAAVFSSHKLEWNEGSTSCTTGGDPVTATASVEYERSPGQGSGSCSIPTWAETSAGEGNDLEYPWPLQRAEHSKHRPVVTRGTSVDLDLTLISHVPTRPLKTEDVTLPLSSTCQPEIPEKTLSPFLQPLSNRQSRLHPQSLERSKVQDAAVVEKFTDTVGDCMVPGTRQPDVFQQVNMSRSPDIDRHLQAGECGAGGKAHHFISENVNPLKLKQRSNELSVGRPAPRKYQRRRAFNGIGMEINSVPTPLDHVLRERQRRDLMTSNVAALELLLPKCSKRDRTSVVYDAIHLLKRLQRDVKSLERRLHDLKLRKSTSARYKQRIPKSIDCNMGSTGSFLSNGVVIKRVGKSMKPVITRTHPTLDTSGNFRPTQRSSIIASTQRLQEHSISDRRTVLVDFHVNLDDTVTNQEKKLLKCRCRMDYLSTMMRVVDEFQLDVISCNIVKMCGYFICIVGLKTRTTMEKTTAALFAVQLQSVVDVDMARERSYNP